MNCGPAFLGVLSFWKMNPDVAVKLMRWRESGYRERVQSAGERAGRAILCSGLGSLALQELFEGVFFEKPISGQFSVLHQTEVGVFLQQAIPFSQLLIGQFLYLDITTDLLNLISQLIHLINSGSGNLVKKYQRQTDACELCLQRTEPQTLQR